jgi:uncharacterized protein YukE
MRSILLSVLLLLVAGPAAAHAATIRVEQQGPGGRPIFGGCYEAYNDDYSVQRCDYTGDADPGVILLPNLGGGTYDVRERSAPPGHYPAGDFTVTLTGTDPDEVETRVRRHEARPVLRIVTGDAAGRPITGSCWLVRPAGTSEGGFEACDDDDVADGVTHVLDLDAADYELLHVQAPKGIDRVDTLDFSMPASDDKTLTFALEPAVAPANTEAPYVTGGHAVGDVLTGWVGRWTGSATIEFYDAWDRCNLDGSGCVPADAYEKTYTVTAEDSGKALRYRVIATNDGGRATTTSALHAVASLDLPDPTTDPTTTGDTTVGQTLTVAAGEWTNSPTFTYQWQRCAADCADIAGATGTTYRTVSTDVGQRIRAIVTASNNSGERAAATAQTAPITDGPVNRIRPSTTGTPAAYNRMDASPGHWDTRHAPLDFTYDWLRCDLDGKTHCEHVGEGEIYVVGQEDEGSTVLVEVTATDATGAAATARSNPRTILILRPLPVVRPSITGTPHFGEKLTGHLGTWAPKPTSYRFYWTRCLRGYPDHCSKVADSDGDRTLKIGDDDIGYTYQFVVWATGPDGGGVARSDETVLSYRIPAVNYRAPSVIGTARVGQKLTADLGEWSKPLDEPLYWTWYRCDPADVEGKQCRQIVDGPDIFDREYKVQRSDFGYTIRIRVVARHDDWPTSVMSEPTAVVPMIPPVNTAAPAINGTARLGEKLTADRGTWTGDGKLEFKHWWTRCNAAGEECQTIAGSENDKTHEVGRDDRHYTLKLRVLATTAEGEAEAWSAATAKIEEQPPVALTDPSIAGTPRVDEKLTANLGVWTSALDLHLNPRWYRCDANGTGCVPIDGADDSTYRLRYTDIDHRIKLQVSAVSDEGNGTAWSAATDVIKR